MAQWHEGKGTDAVGGGGIVNHRSSRPVEAGRTWWPERCVKREQFLSMRGAECGWGGVGGRDLRMRETEGEKGQQAIDGSTLRGGGFQIVEEEISSCRSQGGVKIASGKGEARQKRRGGVRYKRENSGPQATERGGATHG